MDPPRPSRRIQEAQLALRARRLDLIDTAIRLVIPWGSLAAIAYWVHLDVIALAGSRRWRTSGYLFLVTFGSAMQLLTSSAWQVPDMVWLSDRFGDET